MNRIKLQLINPEVLEVYNISSVYKNRLKGGTIKMLTLKNCSVHTPAPEHRIFTILLSTLHNSLLIIKLGVYTKSESEIWPDEIFKVDICIAPHIKWFVLVNVDTLHLSMIDVSTKHKNIKVGTSFSTNQTWTLFIICQ